MMFSLPYSIQYLLILFTFSTSSIHGHGSDSQADKDLEKQDGQHQHQVTTDEGFGLASSDTWREQMRQKRNKDSMDKNDDQWTSLSVG